MTSGSPVMHPAQLHAVLLARREELAARSAARRDARARRGRTSKSGLPYAALLVFILSLFTFAVPALADVGDGPAVSPTAIDFTSGGPEVNCPEGTTGIRFGTSADDDGLLADGESASVTLPGESDPTTVTIFLHNHDDTGFLAFEVDNGLAAHVLVKGGTTQNDYDYTGLPGGGIAEDNHLVAPTPDISHVDFCLIPAPDGSILIYKDDQTGAPVEDATFSVKNDADEEVGTITTEADGFGCLDELEFGDYTVTETLAPEGWDPDPDTEDVTVDSESTCEERLEGAVIADADATFTNTLLGSLLVLKTDGTDPLDGAEFTVEDAEGDPVNGPFTSGDDGDGVFCVDGLVFGDEYTVTETDPPDGYSADANNPQTHEIDVTDDCETRLAEVELDPDLTFVNTLEPETGSITIVKEIDCEICETATPGRWFNLGNENTPGGQFADASLAADPIILDGITFDSVEDVQAEAAPGSLLWHWFGLQMNLREFGEECDLASLVYDGPVEEFQGMTVQEISDAASAILDADHDAVDEDLKNAIEDINESSPEDGTLVCPESDTSGFTFELWLDDEKVTESTTDETGTVVFDDLAFGTYTIVEVSPEGLDCEIVDVTVTEGDEESVTLNENGTITIELTSENQDVVITVVNVCEEVEGGEAPGGNGENGDGQEGGAAPGGGGGGGGGEGGQQGGTSGGGLPDTAIDPSTGSPVALLFAVGLMASLGGLTVANLVAVRRRR